MRMRNKRGKVMRKSVTKGKRTTAGRKRAAASKRGKRTKVGSPWIQGRTGSQFSPGQRPADPRSLQLQHSAAAVVSVRNEQQTIQEVLGQLKRLPLQQIIVIVNGSSDNSFAFARLYPDVTVVNEPEALGHDVGRALGAKLCDTDMILFVDGDFPIMAEALVPFLRAVDKGVDVALNDISGLLGPYKQWDDVSRVKLFMNHALSRSDLKANSMTAVPHAISRRALQTIGVQHLSVPPAAQAAAIQAGLKVRACAQVDVFAKNRIRVQNVGSHNRVASLIIGDHIEALHSAQGSTGRRLAFADRQRRRRQIGGGLPCV